MKASSSTGYVIRKDTGYLEHVPADGSFRFLAVFLRDATVFDMEDSVRLAADFGGVAEPDPLRRPPDVWSSR